MEPRDFQSNNDTEIPPAQGKGKSPASLTSRILSSASGLAKDAVGSSNSNDFAQSLSNGSGGKVANGSASTSQSHWSQTLPARSPISNLSKTRQAESFNENFRSGSNQEAHQHEFEDFMQLDQSSLQNGLSLQGYQNGSSWSGEFQQHQDMHGDSSVLLSNIQNPDDGAEVRMLLSDPHFGLESDSMDAVMAESMDDTVQDLFGGQLSPGEQRAADKIKSSLPPPPVHKAISPENPLNLIPEFGALDQDLQDSTFHLSQDDDNSVYLANTPDREQWVSEWDSVLNSYTDEVWGEMLGAVKAARSQLEEVRAGSKRVDNQAVHRLKMILGHVVQNASSEFAYQQASSFSQSTAETTHLKDVNRHSLAQYEAFLPAMQQTLQNASVASHAINETRSQENHHERLLEPRGHQTHEARRQQRHRDGPLADQEEEHSTPTFHCPWISCHKRFNNPTELRLHTSAHTQLACPHEDCYAQFASHEEWVEHIGGPHHELLETSFRSHRAPEIKT